MVNPVSEASIRPAPGGKTVWNTLTRFAGVTAIPVYVAITLIAARHAPTFGPLTNWLSDYGNPTRNPGGAAWYNSGCIVVAVLLALFYIGLAQWYRGRRVEKKYVICYVCAQVLGTIGTACLIVAAIFPLGVNDAVHSTFGMFNMIGMDCFLSFTAIAFFMHAAMPKVLAIGGYAAAIFNIVCQNAFDEFFLGEWIFFALFMAYIAIVTARYDRLARYEAPTVQ